MSQPYNETNGGVIYVYKRNPSNGAWLFHTMLTESIGLHCLDAFMDVSGDYIIDSGVAPPERRRNRHVPETIFTLPVDERRSAPQVIFTDSRDTGPLGGLSISGDYVLRLIHAARL
jgi:hypothetical protein